MTKGFSLGDFNVNQQAADGASSKKFNLQDFNKQLLPDEEEIKKDTSVKNFIPIQKNADGSVKYTFDNIYEEVKNGDYHIQLTDKPEKWDIIRSRFE